MHACNRARSSVSPARARRARVARACSRELTTSPTTITRTFTRDKKVEECPSDPDAYTGCHACTRERARARPSWHGREWHAHGHMSSHTGVTPAHTYARVIWIRTHTCKGGASTPPCQPPVVAVETKTEIRTSERASENGKDERKAMSNGREKQTKKKECTGNRGAGSRAIVELVSRPIHKRLLSVLPKISLLFFFCLFLSVARLSVFADAILGRNAC